MMSAGLKAVAKMLIPPVVGARGMLLIAGLLIVHGTRTILQSETESASVLVAPGESCVDSGERTRKKRNVATVRGHIV